MLDSNVCDTIPYADNRCGHVFMPGMVGSEWSLVCVEAVTQCGVLQDMGLLVVMVAAVWHAASIPHDV
jgi:hypothetical protein